MERETRIQPLDIYCDALTMNRALKERGRKVTEEIREVVDAIWESENPPQIGDRRGRGRPRRDRQRPPTSSEQVIARAIEREMEIQGYRAWQEQRVGPSRRRTRAQRRPAVRAPERPHRERSTIDKWADLEWKRRWLQAARKKRAATWQTPWKRNPVTLYSDMPKHQATALFLLRTEVIGLNGWLASINVPGIEAGCGCGWSTQTVHHVLIMCPLYTDRRADLVRRTESEEI